MKLFLFFIFTISSLQFSLVFAQNDGIDYTGKYQLVKKFIIAEDSTIHSEVEEFKQYNKIVIEESTTPPLPDYYRISFYLSEDDQTPSRENLFYFSHDNKMVPSDSESQALPFNNGVLFDLTTNPLMMANEKRISLFTSFAFANKDFKYTPEPGKSIFMTITIQSVFGGKPSSIYDAFFEKAEIN